jgi:hypothetical protein
MRGFVVLSGLFWSKVTFWKVAKVETFFTRQKKNRRIHEWTRQEKRVLTRCFPNTNPVN